MDFGSTGFNLKPKVEDCLWGAAGPEKNSLYGSSRTQMSHCPEIRRHSFYKCLIKVGRGQKQAKVRQRAVVKTGCGGSLFSLYKGSLGSIQREPTGAERQPWWQATCLISMRIRVSPPGTHIIRKQKSWSVFVISAPKRGRHKWSPGAHWLV